VNPRNLFTELKRRNVYKVAIAYAVVGWLLVQVATQVFPFFEIPNWAVRLIVLAIVIGFPIALVIAWAFELTPEGLKRTEDVDLAAAAQRPRHRTWIFVIIIAGAISLGLFFLGRVTAPSKQSGVNEVSSKSIAVLPFENLSDDKSNAYFAEGVQDEILTRLAKVADLKVISRTSTQKYKSAPDNLRAIAQQLGVANILEGSVQKANDQVRVNVQLINASNDAHLWADIYDRKVTDMFAAESEIAKTIADTLQAKLSGSEMAAMAKAPTADSEAYELYLKGNYFWNKRTGADFHKAIDYFNQAIAKDPNYALAYVGLANSYLLLSNYGAAAPKDSIPQAKGAAQKALELDSNLAEVHATLAILSQYEFDSQRAITEYERAIKLSPNYANAHHWFGDGPLMALAMTDRSIAEGKRSVELDPLSLINHADLAWDYINARRYDEAIAQCRKAIEIDSHFYLARYYLGEALQLKGQLTEAIVEYRAAVELNDDPLALAFLGQAYARAGQKDDAQKIFGRLTEEAKSRYVSRYSLALVRLGLGDKEGAIDALEQALGNGEGADVYIIRVDPFLDDLRGHPRFEALAEKIVPAREFAKAATTSK
jgi:TolB-like protein/Tfp pilus assembly protein PilF